VPQQLPVPFFACQKPMIVHSHFLKQDLVIQRIICITKWCAEKWNSEEKCKLNVHSN